MKYKQYVLFVSLIVVGLSAFSLISSGYYPILSVNGELVSARTFWKNYRAGSVYYQNVVDTHQAEISQTSLTESDLKRSVLTQIIENNLIDQEVKHALGDDLKFLVQNKLNSLGKNAELQEAAQTLYGLPFAEFEREILVPLAKQEILTGRLFLDNKNLDDWLLENKKISHIRIFSSEFHWDGEEVQINE